MTKSQVKEQINLAVEQIENAETALSSGLDEIFYIDTYKLVLSNNKKRKEYWEKVLEEMNDE